MTTDAYVDPDTGELITPEDFIAKAERTFAKSMPHLPHEYTVKGKTAPGGRVFEWFVRHQSPADRDEAKTRRPNVLQYSNSATGK